MAVNPKRSCECNRCNGYSTFPLTRAHTREGNQEIRLHRLHRLHRGSRSPLVVASDRVNATPDHVFVFGSFRGPSRTRVIRTPLFEVLRYLTTLPDEVLVVVIRLV